MKASSQQQETLLDLSRIDLQLRRNQRLISDIQAGAEVQAARQNLLVNSERLLSVRNDLDALQLELRRAEADLELVEGRIEKDQARIQQSSSQKDIQGMQNELQSLLKRKGELEEAEIVLLDREQQMNTQLEEVQAQREVLQKELAALEDEQTAGLAKLNSGQQLLRENRARDLQNLSAELAEHYEKLFAKGIGVGKLIGLVCDACGMTLSGDSLDSARNTPMDELAHCGECGAILVR